MDTLFIAFALFGISLVVAAIALAIMRRGRPAVAIAVSGAIFLALAVGVAAVVHNSRFDDCVRRVVRASNLSPAALTEQRAMDQAIDEALSGGTADAAAPLTEIEARDRCGDTRVLDGVFRY